MYNIDVLHPSVCLSVCLSSTYLSTCLHDTGAECAHLRGHPPDTLHLAPECLQQPLTGLPAPALGPSVPCPVSRQSRPRSPPSSGLETPHLTRTCCSPSLEGRLFPRQPPASFSFLRGLCSQVTFPGRPVRESLSKIPAGHPQLPTGLHRVIRLTARITISHATGVSGRPHFTPVRPLPGWLTGTGGFGASVPAVSSAGDGQAHREHLRNEDAAGRAWGEE